MFSYLQYSRNIIIKAYTHKPNVRRCRAKKILLKIKVIQIKKLVHDLCLQVLYFILGLAVYVSKYSLLHVSAKAIKVFSLPQR